MKGTLTREMVIRAIIEARNISCALLIKWEGGECKIDPIDVFTSGEIVFSTIPGMDDIPIGDLTAVEVLTHEPIRR